MPDKDSVLNVLQEKVMDPELMMNIVDLGLIYDVEMTSETVADVTMTLTSPGCPAGPQIIKSVQDEAQKAFPELDTVNVHLVWNALLVAGHDVRRGQGRTGHLLTGVPNPVAGRSWKLQAGRRFRPGPWFRRERKPNICRLEAGSGPRGLCRFGTGRRVAARIETTWILGVGCPGRRPCGVKAAAARSTVHPGGP